MSARQVHAVLAAGVENPTLIARWQSEPELLLGHGVQPESIDLSALWKFAGLTTKVRHNGLRDDLPLTFRFMSVAGLEIEVFASYAGFRAAEGGGFASTIEARTSDLIAYLEGWLDQGQVNHALLWDLIRHEQAIAQLTRSSPTTPDSHLGAPYSANGSTPAPGTPSSAGIVHICGDLILHEMRCDPRAVASVLRSSKPPLDQIPLEIRCVGYWRAPMAPHIEILELDEFGYYLLSLVDGVRSAGKLNRLLGGARRPSRGFLQSLARLGDMGVLRFVPAARSGSR